MSNINDTLQEREKRYGKFTGHAKVSQSLQKVMIEGFEANDWGGMKHLDDDMREALFMIAHKLGRIVNGDSWYADSWKDIAGYATLIANRLEGETNE